MAEFQVTASTLKQKAEELSTLNNNFAKKVEELMASEKSLSGMWEGQAKEAFENGTSVAWANDNTEVIAFSLQNKGYTVGIPSLGSNDSISVGTTRTV